MPSMFVEVCLFLDDLSCRIFVTSIFCPLDVLSVDVLSVSLFKYLLLMIHYLVTHMQQVVT